MVGREKGRSGSVEEIRESERIWSVDEPIKAFIFITLMEWIAKKRSRGKGKMAFSILT